jgi:hypothetical protein
MTADEHGWTDLDRAAGRGDTAEVQRLLADGDRRSAYDIALAAGHLETARVLRDPAGDYEWRPYCRAYRLAELRAFAGWPSGQGEDAVVYLHDDFRVTATAWSGEDVLFDAVTDEWRAFCTGTLGFRVPDDFDLVAGDR